MDTAGGGGGMTGSCWNSVAVGKGKVFSPKSESDRCFWTAVDMTVKSCFVVKSLQRGVRFLIPEGDVTFSS